MICSLTFLYSQYKTLQADITHALNATTHQSSKLIDKIKECQDKTEIPSPSFSFLETFSEPTTPVWLQNQFLKMLNFLRLKIPPGWCYYFIYYSPGDSLRRAIDSYFYQTKQNIDAALKSAKALSQSVEQSTAQLLRVSKQEKEAKDTEYEENKKKCGSGRGSGSGPRAAAVQYFDALVEEIMVRLGTRDPEVRRKELHSILKLYHSLGGLSKEVEGKLENLKRELGELGVVQKDMLMKDYDEIGELRRVFEEVKEGLIQGWEEWERLRRRFDREV